MKAFRNFDRWLAAQLASAKKIRRHLKNKKPHILCENRHDQHHPNRRQIKVPAASMRWTSAGLAQSDGTTGRRFMTWDTQYFFEINGNILVHCLRSSGRWHISTFRVHTIFQLYSYHSAVFTHCAVSRPPTGTQTQSQKNKSRTGVHWTDGPATNSEQHL